jgi:hypothetical protein
MVSGSPVVSYRLIGDVIASMTPCGRAELAVLGGGMGKLALINTFNAYL